jgi:hypothetical protein
VVYLSLVLIGLITGVALELGLTAFFPTSNLIPQLSLVPDTGRGGVRMAVGRCAGGNCGASSISKNCAGNCHASGISKGRNIFSLIDVSLTNSTPISVNGLVVNEIVNAGTLPVLVTQDAYYVLQSSQQIPTNAYVAVTGTLTVYSISPYDSAQVCSPFDCSYLLLQIQVTQFTVLYQGT